MNNIQQLITGDAAIDYINVTTIIVNSIALFASVIFIIFFILNIILRILYNNLQKIINWRFNRDFILFPNDKQITLTEFYNDIKLINNKQQIDQEFMQFQNEMKEHSKKMLIFKKIIQILITLIKYSINYKKFMRLIDNLRILYCCFSTNIYSDSFNLIYNNYYFQIKIVDVNYFQIITTFQDQEIKFNIRVTKYNHYKLCKDQLFNSEQTIFINNFLKYFNLQAKIFYKYLKKNIFIFPKANWKDVNEAIVENIKAYHRYRKINKKYWIIKLKKKLLIN